MSKHFLSTVHKNKTLKGKFDYAYIKPLSHYSGEMIKAQKILEEKDTSADVKNHVTIKIRKNKQNKHAKKETNNHTKNKKNNKNI